MKNVFYTLLSSLCFTMLNAQPPCNEDSIMSMIGKWKKAKDANLQPDKNMPQIISRIDKISQMFQAAYPNPRGTEPKWYKTMEDNPLVPGGPTAYNYQSLSHYWYCNQNTNKLMLSGETGNWAFVHINNLHSFFWEQYDTLEVNVENRTVYLLPNPKGEWKGYPVYDFDGKRSIVLTHNNQLPWKTITQEQFLNALKSHWQNEKKKNADNYAGIIAEKKKTIKEWQDKKDLPPASKAEIIASLQKDLEEWQKIYPAQLEKIYQMHDEKIAVVDNYIEQNASELKKAAIIEANKKKEFSGSFSNLQQGGQMLVVLDPAYFNKRLPAYVPQLMVLSWSWGDDKPGLYFKQQIEENFPVQKLKEMIDK